MIKSFFYVTALLFDKTIATCSPGCNEQFIGDYVCDIECNNSYCDFDGGDCLDMDYLYDINVTNTTNTTTISNYTSIVNTTNTTNVTNTINTINTINTTNTINDFYSQEFYDMFDTDIGSNTGSCNLTNCPNLFFDDCNILQKYTNKWCNFDEDDHDYDICCAKYHTDCCEYDVLAVFLASFSFFLIIICSCYGMFKMFSVCCDE